MRKVDATSGNLLKLLFIYTIPLILTTIAQHLFTMVDTAVLGNMADTTAVASVGATNTITALVLNGVTGLATGSSIVLARFIGQKNVEKIRSTIDTALLTALIFGVIVAVVGVTCTPLFLKITDCPQGECFDGAALYLRIYISAAPITLLYNYGAAILRTMGDTQRPLVYILISGVVNVVLNIVLCLILPQKVAAVAIATVASKLISAVLVLRRLCRMEEHRVILRKLRFHPSAFRNIIQYGVPTSISNLLYPVANLQVVPAINSFGVDAMAGNSACVNIHNFISAIVAGFGNATTTFMGQNIGAEKKERVQRSFWYCLGFGVLITGSVSVAFYVTGRFWLGLILGRSATAAIEYGMIRMLYVSLFVFISLMNSVLLHALQAYGYPFFGSISSIVFTLGFRIFWMQLIYPHYESFEAVMSCFTVSWTLNMLFNAVFVAILNRRYAKGIYKKI